ncbi:MAG: alpha-mannosidase [Eubacterium sp.]|nr:alpha-mannosidase [Eubacterium sp.]
MKNTAFVVSNAHLDTVWRWRLAKTIEEYLPDTLTKNFDLLEKYPNYRFNFEGAYRYELIEEFYPKAFDIIKKYVKQGRWIPAGAVYETGDMNIPSPEAIFRNLNYGGKYFSKKFNYLSNELFIPDCFGIGYATASICALANLKGITTQKLSWGSAYGIPFDLGMLQGPDSSRVYASLNAKSYRHKFSFNDDIRASVSIIDRIADNAATSGIPWSNHLYGTGDWGGSPTEESVAAVEKSVRANKDTPHFEIVSAAAGDVFEALDKLDESEKKKLPVWNNELLMTSHGAGCYTSRAMSKRLNAQCESMGQASELACANAYMLLNDYQYPVDNMENAWKNVIKHQFHDDITGTSTMEVYNDSWSDYYQSLFTFKSEYQTAVGRLLRAFNTSWVDNESVAVAVHNPTQFERKECVEIKIRTVVNCKYIKVFDKAGNEIPSQIISKKGKALTVVFEPTMKPYSYKIFEIRKSEEPCSIDTGLSVHGHTLENKKYKLIFNKNGDIAYLYDKKLKRQVISSPIKMALLHDVGSLAYPSWEILKEDIDREPYCYANTPKFTIVEEGPARVRIKVEREAEFSTIVQLVSLTASGEIVEVKNHIDWKTRRTLLKAVFPLASSNEKATYDLGLGVIERGNNTEKLYEVPAQKWADITEKDKSFGVSILSDCKYGWDKPDNNTLRLSCIHTPSGAFTKDARQDLQDLGRNIFSFAIYSHKGDYTNASVKEAEKFTRPMLVCQTNARSNYTDIDDEFSFMSINNDNAVIRSFSTGKLAVDKCVRIYETEGKEQKNVKLSFFNKLYAVYSAYASGLNGKPYPFEEKSFEFDLKPFEVKCFNISFFANVNKVETPKIHYRLQRLPYNTKGFTSDDNMRNVILQGSGFSLPNELYPHTFYTNGIRFKTFRNENDVDANDVFICRDQSFNVESKEKRMYFLAASTLGTQELTVLAGKRKIQFQIRDITEPICKWDMAGLDQKANIYDGNNIKSGFEFTHTHHPEGNKPEKARFHLYSANVSDCREVTFCENNKVVILGLTFTDEEFVTELASKVIDTVPSNYEFNSDIPPIDKIVDKADFVTIRAGKIQDQIKSGKGKGIRRDNIITNIIRSYTKSEW